MSPTGYTLARSLLAVSLFYLLQCMEATGFVGRLVYGEWDGKGGDKISETLNLALFAACLWLFVQGMRRTRALGRGAILAIGAACVLLASTAWSIDPSVTLRRGIIYLFVVLGAVGIAARTEPDEFFELLLLSCGLAALASLILLVVTPTGAVMLVSGELRGAFSHKNMLGQVMAVGTLSATHCIRVGRHRARSILMLILFIVVGALSRSATSLFTIIVYCTLSAIVVLQARSGAARMFAACLGILLVPLTIISFVFMDDVLTLVGKDPTLTGRTELWQYAMSDIGQRPLLGWGYSAFWTPTNEAAMEISLKLHWFVPQAHNGLLEILLSIGTAGAGYFIFVLARNVWLAIKCLNTPSRDFALSSLFFYGGLIATGVSETILMEPLQITTCLFFIIGLMCEKSLRPLPARAFRGYRPAVPLRAA